MNEIWEVHYNIDFQQGNIKLFFKEINNYFLKENDHGNKILPNQPISEKQ